MSKKISKKIHIVWVGDESKCPINCIDTWRKLNPLWEVKIWSNQDLLSYGWYNSKHIESMWSQELNGVADLMRWEILYREGGFALDADSICIRPLEDWLFEPECFTCYENEIVRPGLLAAGYVYARPNSSFIRTIIEDLYVKPSVTENRAWFTVGPMQLTRIWQQTRYAGLTIYPSHYFIPNHPETPYYKGTGHVFAKQFWASTKNSYDKLHEYTDNELKDIMIN